MFVFLVVFVLVSGLLIRLSLRLNADRRRALARLRDLEEQDGSETARSSLSTFVLSALPRVGALLQSREEGRRATLQTRLVRAGIYGGQAVRVFLGARLVLAVTLPAAAFVPWLLGLLSTKWALPAGLVAAGLGALAPGLWLDRRTRRRQSELRRTLPDALDMLVLCLEGSVSLVAAIQRVTAELEVAHPALGAEMHIVQREI